MLFWVFFFGLGACETLPYQTEIEPTPSALEGEVLTTRSLGKSLDMHSHSRST